MFSHFQNLISVLIFSAKKDHYNVKKRHLRSTELYTSCSEEVSEGYKNNNVSEIWFKINYISTFQPDLMENNYNLNVTCHNN